MSIRYAADPKCGVEVIVSSPYTHIGDASVTAYSIDAHNDERIVLSINTGASTTYLRPTAAEARDLIAALQWALEPAEQVEAA